MYHMKRDIKQTDRHCNYQIESARWANSMKITQPIKTQTFRLSIGPIASKLVHKALNCSKWHQICPNSLEQVKMGSNGSIGVPNWSPKQGFKIIMNSIGWPLSPGLLGLVVCIETFPTRTTSLHRQNLYHQYQKNPTSKAKFAKKKLFSTAILHPFKGNFFFKYETTSFHYSSPRILKILKVWTLDFWKWGQKDC